MFIKREDPREELIEKHAVKYDKENELVTVRLKSGRLKEMSKSDFIAKLLLQWVN